MKIAIITSGFLPVVDGVTVSGMSRLQRLSRWGHQVLLFCPDYSALESVYPNWKEYSGEILPNVRVVNLPSTPFMDLDFERNVAMNAYPILLKELEGFQPDVIHVDEPERLFFGFFRIPGVKFAKQNGIPCVGFFRTNFLEYAEDYFPLPAWGIAIVRSIFQKIFAWIYNAYNITLVSSKVTHPKLIEMGITNTQYANLLGFDSEKFNPNLREEKFFENRYRLPEVDRQVKLIFLGRLTPDKGWEFTFDALPILSQSIDLDNVAFLIAGDGPSRDEIAEHFGKFHFPPSHSRSSSSRRHSRTTCQQRYSRHHLRKRSTRINHLRSFWSRNSRDCTAFWRRDGKYPRWLEWFFVYSSRSRRFYPKIEAVS